MKKYLQVTILLALLLIISIPVDAKTTSNNWYKKVLNNKSAVYKNGKKKYKRKSYKYYNLFDINKDGTKELVLSKTKGGFIPGDGSALLLTYYKKKIKVVKSFAFDGGCSLGRNSSNKTIVFFNRDSGSASYTAYSLIRGSLKQKENTTYKRLLYNTYPYYDYVYKVNGKKVSQNNWSSYSKKLYGKEISYKKIP